MLDRWSKLVMTMIQPIVFFCYFLLKKNNNLVKYFVYKNEIMKRELGCWWEFEILYSQMVVVGWGGDKKLTSEKTANYLMSAGNRLFCDRSTSALDIVSHNMNSILDGENFNNVSRACLPTSNRNKKRLKRTSIGVTKRSKFSLKRLLIIYRELISSRSSNLKHFIY